MKSGELLIALKIDLWFILIASFLHLTRPLNFLGCVSPTLPPKGQPLTRAKKEEPGRPDRAGRENSNCTVILNDPLGKNSEVAAPSSSCFAWEVWYSSVVLALQLSSYLASCLAGGFFLTFVLPS